jgi:phosphatidylethanolamine/phosphatidyl-N-methylethanolamine N-methyltransferase
MEKAVSPLRETLTFLRRWCAHPYRLGAFLPSSQALARFMAKEALKDLGDQDYVLELGGGTGRFTRALLNEGLPQERLICLELDKKLADYLQTQFPDTRIIQGNACFLESLIPDSLVQKVGAVVSGLPMLSFPSLVQEKILNGSFSFLKNSGKFLQFTYSPFASINAQRFGLDKKRLGYVWANVPPATIWCYTRHRLWH